MKRTSFFPGSNAAVSLNAGTSFLQLSNNCLGATDAQASSKDSIMEKTFVWTYNIVASCNNDFHFDCADALIQLFAQKYGDSEMLFQLKQLRQYKWSNVHGILN
jgi:hypothetical protein